MQEHEEKELYMFRVREVRDDDGIEYRILYLERVYLEKVQGSVISTMNSKNLQGTPMEDRFFRHSQIEGGGATRQHSCQPLIILSGLNSQNNNNGDGNSPLKIEKFHFKKVCKFTNN